MNSVEMFQDNNVTMNLRRSVGVSLGRGVDQYQGRNVIRYQDSSAQLHSLPMVENKKMFVCTTYHREEQHEDSVLKTTYKSSHSTEALLISASIYFCISLLLSQIIYR